MNIDIVCVGRIKERYLTDAIAEYSKRLSRYCKLNIIEVRMRRRPNTPLKALTDRSRPKKANASPSI